MNKSMFLNVFKGEEAYLLHNTLYGTMIRAACDITKSIVDNLEKDGFIDYTEDNEFHDALKSSKMVVEKDINETNLLNYYFSTVDSNILGLTLIVTRQCNFRCVYCYEKFVNESMSKEIYEDILKAIKKEVESKGFRVLTVSFFGGEPMLEYEAICSFIEELNELADELEIKVLGTMTTNGYLLNLERFVRLVKLGVTSYQITIDGLEENHNKNRFLAGGGGSWKEIVKNVKKTKECDEQFIITIRINFDASSLKGFEEFIEFISLNFADDDRYFVHFEAIKKLGGLNDDELETAENEAESVGHMTSFARGKGMNISAYGISPFSRICYAAKNNNYIIDTDGTLMKCTVDIDGLSNKIGKLTKSGFEIESHKICNWTSYNLLDECKNCKILPLCFGRQCPIAMNGMRMHNSEHCENIKNIYESSVRTIAII